MPNRQEQLDEFKLRAAKAILESVSLEEIRVRSVANLNRWNMQGTWCSAYDEWRAIMTSGSDTEVVRAMSDTDEHSNRLRQSPPYTGLISEEQRDVILREVGLRP